MYLVVSISLSNIFYIFVILACTHRWGEVKVTWILWIGLCKSQSLTQYYTHIVLAPSSKASQHLKILEDFGKVICSCSTPFCNEYYRTSLPYIPTHTLELTTLIHKIVVSVVASVHELRYDHIKVFKAVGTTLLKSGGLGRLTLIWLNVYYFRCTVCKHLFLISSDSLQVRQTTFTGLEQSRWLSSITHSYGSLLMRSLTVCCGVKENLRTLISHSINVWTSALPGERMEMCDKPCTNAHAYICEKMNIHWLMFWFINCCFITNKSTLTTENRQLYSWLFHWILPSME